MLQKAIRYRAVSGLALLSLVFVAGGSAWAYASLLASGTGPYIMHFNDMTGITSVGDATPVAFAGVLGVIVVLMNFFIALEFEQRDGFLGKVLAGGTLIFAVLLFLACAAILNVNA
ncbi:MAG TPA: hypothetical protein VMT99_00535 [Candidatus Paceibacterota bacterium]|nr:hypothetical protein [Candidatus Paceibacterota bacterium]